jgi:hypothetical protein
MTLFVILVVLAIAAAAAIALGAARVRRSAVHANEVVPGTPTRAPIGWAGAHTPEALLHRRLRTVVDAARAQGEPGSDAVREAVERGALEIDERLIAAAALPEPQRADAIASITPSVAALENAVSGGKAVGRAGPGAPAELEGAMQDVQNRLDAIAQARAEVDQLDVTRPAPQAET